MSIEQVHESIKKACKRIAPAWPLENSVAVNPYLGLSDKTFEQAAEVLKYRGDIDLYMPLGFYQKQINEGRIRKSDIETALKNKSRNESVDELLHELQYLKDENHNGHKISTLIHVAERHRKIDFSEIMINHTSEWLSAYFNQSSETTPEEMFLRWKREASLDLLPELSGIKKFRSTVKSIPNSSRSAVLLGLERLNIPEQLVETYLHALLLKTVGWSSYCAGLDWQGKLYNGNTDYLKALLGILITWESSLLNTFEELRPEWKKSLPLLEAALTNMVSDEYFETQSVLQDAFDLSFQRELRNKFNTLANATSQQTERPLAQMVFCIDVRSEIYRKNLEAVNDKIETIGFAGFFGFPVKYTPINHEKGKNQCPVLIPSGPEVNETTNHSKTAKKVKQSLQRKGILNQAWSKFRTGSVSSFSFVSPLGILYLPKLISNSFGWTAPVKNPKKGEFGQIISGKRKLDVTTIPLEDRVKMAHGALTAMGLVKQFAPLVLITGHGSTSVNNPHASGLDCGACGGNSGEINAITAQLILNDKNVREALKKDNIVIPNDTFFVACAHDTTTDTISILRESDLPESHTDRLSVIKESIHLASQAARKSRAPRLGIPDALAETFIMKRANDWSQVRPEWGLAGCSSFIIAPRSRTKGMDLEGKAFLHSYNWQSDEEFKLLETIMTAPMIVTSWINLQYYASTVDNKRLGAGNKTLHNVTAKLGVIEGSKGDLRIGLPYQSIHDGKNYQHQPLRLNVVIEAPKEAVGDIITKHSNLTELCDNNWITIMILNTDGRVSHRYAGNGNWEDLIKEEIKTEQIKYQVETI